MKKIIMLLILVAILAAIAKALEGQKKQWTGLTESQARAKLDKRMGSRMPADKKAQVTDKVVAKMRARGHLKEEAAS